MPEFIIESPHTPEECLASLDVATADRTLDTFKFGCLSGDHTAYAIVGASSEDEARRLVPHLVRDKAHVRRISDISPEQVKRFHRQAA